MGIEAVYQDQAVVDCLSVSKNVFLGRELTKKFGPFRFLDKAENARADRSFNARDWG